MGASSVLALSPRSMTAPETKLPSHGYAVMDEVELNVELPEFELFLPIAIVSSRIRRVYGDYVLEFRLWKVKLHELDRFFTI